MNDLTHIDLFSGIGGFSLAAAWAGFHTITMCEIDPFCQKVLKARFGAVADADCRIGEQPTGEDGRAGRRGASSGYAQGDDFRPVLIPDIHDFDGSRFRGATLLTGGFPCQPFSHAGKRRGKEDDRALWPQMLRVIHEARPAWVIGENVSGLISMELDQVLADLELEGYACRAFHIGAVGVNAPHRRMRVWIVGNRTDAQDARCELREGTEKQGVCDTENGRSSVLVERPTGTSRPIFQSAADSDAQNSQDERLQGRHDRGEGVEAEGNRLLSPRPNLDAPDAEGRETQPSKPGGLHPESGGTSWDIPWLEVATRLCRVDDGLPAWVHARRVQRLKALGNAIVPQVAYQIIKAIAEIEG